MKVRTVVCEGPDDLNALRAIAQHVFEAETEAQPGRQGGAGGEERKATLRSGESLVEIVVPSKGRGDAGDGKSQLPLMVAKKLNDLAPQGGPPTEPYTDLVAAVFDPDDEPEPKFHERIEVAIGSLFEDLRPLLGPDDVTAEPGGPA